MANFINTGAHYEIPVFICSPDGEPDFLIRLATFFSLAVINGFFLPFFFGDFSLLIG